MTNGHKHREVRVKAQGLAHRILHAPLVWSHDLDRIDASPYPWGPYSESRFRDGDTDQPYYLSALSVLHRWTGLTLRFDDPDPDVRRCRECGCTDVTACSPPCSWAEPDLCSACA